MIAAKRGRVRISVNAGMISSEDRRTPARFMGRWYHRRHGIGDGGVFGGRYDYSRRCGSVAGSESCTHQVDRRDELGSVLSGITHFVPKDSREYGGHL